MTILAMCKRPASLLAFTLTLLFLGSIMQREFGHYTNKDVDFFAYYFAGRVIHDNPKADLYYGALNGNPESHTDAPPGSPIYEQAEAAGVKEVMFFLYPPILADMLAPISTLSPQTAAAVWRAVNLALILLSLVALARMLAIPLGSTQFGILALAALAFFPIYEALAIGQITIVLLALWAITVAAYGQGRVALSACALALATALKLTPLLAVPVFLIYKDKRWLAWYAAALAFLIVAMGLVNGWPMLAMDVKVIGAVGGSVPLMQNKTLSGLLAWLYYGRFVPMDTGPGLNPPHLLVVAGKVLGLGFYAVCLFLVWRQRLQTSLTARVTALSIFALVTPLISPLSWRHAYTIALVPLIILWVQAVRTSVSTLHLALLTLSTLAMGTLFFDLVAQAHIPSILQILSAGLLAISTAALCLETLSHAPPPALAGFPISAN
jgi:hypothetical protein